MFNHFHPPVRPLQGSPCQPPCPPKLERLFQRCQKPVYPSGPSKYVRARLDVRLWKIACLKPVFLWFCPSICDFGHVQSVQRRYRAAWQTGQQCSERAQNHKKTTKLQKLEFCPSLCPTNGRIFVQKNARLFTKMSLSEELGTLR